MPTLEESKAARRFSFFEDSAKCVYEAAAHSRRLAAHAEAMKKCRMDAVNEMKKTGFDEKEEVAAAFDAARARSLFSAHGQHVSAVGIRVADAKF